MHGVKGRITRATGGDHLHITLHKGDQMLHTKISSADGLLYEVLRMLYHHGIAMNP